MLRFAALERLIHADFIDEGLEESSSDEDTPLTVPTSTTRRRNISKGSVLLMVVERDQY